MLNFLKSEIPAKFQTRLPLSMQTEQLHALHWAVCHLAHKDSTRQLSITGRPFDI